MTQPLLHWLDHRSSGVLLHPTALPGDYGIGTFNDHCLDFIDFLAEAGLGYWQVCPLGPTGYGNSPYQSFSVFAGNPYLISLRALQAKDLVSAAILDELGSLPRAFVDYGGLHNAKWPVLQSIYDVCIRQEKGRRLPYGDFDAFKEAHAEWLEPFAYFQALKERFDGAPWTEWPPKLRSFPQAKRSPLRKELAEAIDAQRFFQYLFFGQWEIARDRARRRGVRIVGDLPIFVSMDSADVWQNPERYQLDQKTLKPKAVAGCPPDYFSASGQLWGNPLYDWKALKAEGYDWWIKRLEASFRLYDVVRIDHFRGFESYWKIPYGDKTAANGKWTKGPGLDFFKTVKRRLPNAKLIAEDLGDIDAKARKLRRDSGLPGMAVLQFAFGDGGDNFYLPHNLQHNCVLYPGTHDNDTTRGWYGSAPEKTRDHARRYLRVSGEEIGWDFVRAAYASVARLCIVPLQDLLSLGSEARFNIPGSQAGNWEWRMSEDQLASLRGEPAAYLKELADLYYREGKPAVNVV